MVGSGVAVSQFDWPFLRLFSMISLRPVIQAFLNLLIDF